ncbi:MAG: DUF3696 domain-containing protein [Bacteroidaceae bacterium]|nr:DUF3696 domain-containing protein [Bacteroidaceae bacterium]
MNTMLEYIVLKNFKCFDELQIRLAPLTLVTGMNGVGKSTLIQSLLIIRQSFVARYLQDGYISLNGELVNLINGSALLYNQANDECVEVRIEDEEDEYIFTLPKVENDNHLQLMEISPEGYTKKGLLLLEDDFVYLNAERLSPQIYYKPTNSSEKNYSRMGNRHGDKAVGVLFDAIDKVDDLNIVALKAETAASNRVGDNVSAWLGYIMGTKITAKVEKVNSEDLRLTYTVGDVAKENVFSPLNTAFGNSYLLPIIVAVLTAKKGGLILLENPEAHLHPAAQFRLGKLLAMAAEQGIQLIVETHSDHLLNGIRVAAKNGQISSDNVAIQYFVEHDGCHDAQRIVLNNDGELDCWPQGFFDEWEKALDSLIG